MKPNKTHVTAMTLPTAMKGEVNGHGDQHSKENTDECKPGRAEGLILDDSVSRGLAWEAQVVRDDLQLWEAILHLADDVERLLTALP